MYTHRYIQLTSVLVALVFGSAVSQQEYTIVPERMAQECSNLTNGTSCLTAKQLGNINQENVNISLVFTEGNHWLSERYAFVNISSLYLVGGNRSTITCQGKNSGFSFENIENLKMENLSIRGCIQNGTVKGGAVSIRNIDLLQITQCSFSENEAFMNGGALYVEHSDSVVINDCAFFNNSVTCMSCEGGALDIVNTSTVLIHHSSFKQNTAMFKDGGAISSVATEVSITDSAFTSNKAGNNGGAVAIQGLAANISDTEFIANQAMTEGGAIHVQYVNIHISHTKFSQNQATSGGAISVLNGTLFNFNNTYFFNTANNSGCMNVYNSFVRNDENTYKLNRAYTSGGCISAESSFLVETECQHTLSLSTVGGSIFVKSSTIRVTRNYFKNNAAFVSGGAIYASDSTVDFEQTNFTKNSALGGPGGAIQAVGSIVNTRQTNFISNNAQSGGAVSTIAGMLWTAQSSYINNTGTIGGSNFIFCSYVFIEKCHYEGNSGQVGGVTFANHSIVSSNSTLYIQNNASIVGGVSAAFGSMTTVSLIENEYVQNFAPIGGVLMVSEIKLLDIENCIYSNNTAIIGGATVAKSTTVRLTGSIFTGNTATLPNLQQRIIETDDSVISVSAITGGAISVTNCYLSSLDTDYIGNKATHFSGAIYASESSLTIVGGTFSSNVAEKGAAIYVTANKTTISNCTFISNQAFNSSVLFALSAEINIADNFLFQNNSGSITTFDSKLTFQGDAILVSNNGTAGGAITSIQSSIEFAKSSTMTIRQNCAKFGGAISLTETVCIISSSNVVIEYNTATENGGGIYAIQSQIEVNPRGMNDTIVIAHNTAHSNGGGFHAIASQIKLFRGHLLVDSNHAYERGGAFYLESNSKIYVNKMEKKTINGRKMVILSMVFNMARIGGAVYIEDTTNTGSLCKGVLSANQEPLIPAQCFLQTIQLYPNFPLPLSVFDMTSQNKPAQMNATTTAYNNVLFANNTAEDTGSAIYGGLLDRCALNPLSELSINEENISLYNGFDYIKLMVEFEGLVDYETLRMDTNSYPLNIIQTISKAQISSLITSLAVKVCFCTHGGIDCAYNPSTIWIEKGKTFSLHLAAVDQLENPTQAKLITKTQSASGIHRLKEGQGDQILKNICTEVNYNVFASGNSAQLQLYADGPCGDLGISMRTLNISFTTCTCPVGFTPVPSEIECICLCQNQLMNHVDETECKAENRSIKLIENVWIGLTTTDNQSNFIVENCPFDYCVEKPFTLILDELTIDDQCNYNRTGHLCGRCKNGLSMVFGSSNCQDGCSNIYLFLLIPFALAGIALVALILILNMTVATGTTNGIIFYANILVANHSIFLQDSKNPLSVFIAWINLDLGFEICFYNGMDTYGKFLLQLVFPVYVFILVAGIIIASQYSTRLSALLGKRNPIATLSTLILLSYSKLLRMIIASLQFGKLHFPENTLYVWLPDANVLYYQDPSHFARFIVAILVFIFGSVYTILLLFAQCFHSCSKKRLLKWLRNPKYNAFIDAYHAPFTPNSRYWVGLLLMLRIIHFLISAFVTPAITVLSVGCTAFFILSVRVMSTKTYKLWPNNVLENLFIINLGLLAIFTYFIMLTNGQQSTITNISLCITLILFAGITFYHLHEYILKSFKFYQRGLLKMHSLVDRLRGLKKEQTTVQNKNQPQDDCGYRDEAIVFGTNRVIMKTNLPLAFRTPSTNTTFSIIDSPNDNYTPKE